MDNLTPMMRQYHQVKQEHPGMLVFFRLGDFYEMFYEDAVLASKELDITLTSRNQDRKGKPIPMCGVPHHSVDTYLARLLKRGYKVALCEQVEDPREAQGIVRREVTRILTPGTAIEESVLDSKQNNYLASLLWEQETFAAAVLDVSTGEFLAMEFSGPDSMEQLLQEFHHFSPSELLFPEAQGNSEILAQLSDRLGPELVRTPQPDWVFNADYAQRILLEHFRLSSLDGYGLEERHSAVGAAGALLSYVKQTQDSAFGHINGISLLEPGDHLRMDDSTVENLELVKGTDGTRKWTLYDCLDLTRTGMGARLLRQWILRPSLNLAEIESRLDAVEELNGSVVGMGRLGQLLESVHDLERLLSRVTLERATPRDLLALRDSIAVLPGLLEVSAGYQASLLRPKLDLLEDVLDLLQRSILEEAPASTAEGGVIRAGYNPELDELREISRSGKSFIAGLESSERQRTGISSLKVRFNRVFGYFIEVTRANLASVPDNYVRKQTLAGAERYITPELKEYEEKVLGAEDRIQELERELFLAVRRKVAEEAGRIRHVALILAQIDVLLAFAEAARRHRYVRPRLSQSCELRIRAGRHPVLELQGRDPFIPNDLTCNTKTDQMLILTGPNMGGKSTYLRQNALIVLMAQAGSFVPADEAEIGLVDRIFTRVGASDNLARGRSTFMVEMIETARILNTATPRSLILLDEVGRGTATFDGLSIAWAVAEYLICEGKRRARTLFATHYQELTRLEERFEGVKNYCVAVREGGTEIIFFHRVLPGVASKSYGIEVARLAGMPVPVLERAREILSRLERKQLDLTGHSRASHVSEEAFGDLQQTLFSQ